MDESLTNFSRQNIKIRYQRFTKKSSKRVILVVTQDGTTMSQNTKDLSKQKSAKIPDYTAYIIERGERAVEKYLDDWLNRLNRQNTPKT